MLGKEKFKKIGIASLKWGLFVGLLWFLYQKLINIPLESYSGAIEGIYSLQSIGIVCVVFVMTIANWAFESYKWQFLISKIERINLWISFRYVFIGLSLSLFTPNRIGDIFARCLGLSKGNRKKGIALSSVGSFSQFVISLWVGLLSLFYLVINGYMGFEGDKFLKISVLILISIAVFFMIVFSFRLADLVYLTLGRFSYSWIDKMAMVFEMLSVKDIFQIHAYSLARFVLYTFQFYLLLVLFNIEGEKLVVFISIPLVYLVMTLIPSSGLMKLGVREFVAVEIISLYSAQTESILLASIALWVFNVALPSLLGGVLLLREKNIPSMRVVPARLKVYLRS